MGRDMKLEGMVISGLRQSGENIQNKLYGTQKELIQIFLNSNDSCSKIRIDKWDLMKLESFCKKKKKKTVNRTNQQLKDWEKNFTNPTSNRGPISKIYKELKKLITIKQTTQLRTRCREF
jgi:predicted GTPase